MCRVIGMLFLKGLSLIVPFVVAQPESPVQELFLVNNVGLILVAPNGGEKERLKPYCVNGAFSPDGKWLACVVFPENTRKAHIAIISRGAAEERVIVPM